MVGSLHLFNISRKFNMKKLLVALTLCAFSLGLAQANERTCVTIKDSKQVCKVIKKHKKLKGTKISEAKKDNTKK